VLPLSPRAASARACRPCCPQRRDRPGNPSLHAVPGGAV